MTAPGGGDGARGIRDLRRIHRSRWHEVYRGAMADGRRAVLKVARGEYPPARVLASLRHEYEVLSEIDAPGVVRPYDLDESHGYPVLVLEDAGPTTLTRRIEAGPMPVAAFLDLAIELSRAVWSVHREAVMHRAIEPSNIVLDTADQPTLIDFAAATRLAQVEPLTRSPATLGTALRYVAPEETGRTGQTADYRADLYSLGAVFYALLSGRPPFDAQDPMEVIHAHLARQPPPIERSDEDVPEVLEALIGRLLAKAPEDRYQSAEALTGDLGEARRQLHGAGRIERFPLGRSEGQRILHLPHRLYGRAPQERALRDAFARACSRTPVLVLVSGDPGSGKSALAQSLAGPVTARRGTFVSGRFEPPPHVAPYAAIASAFAALVDQLLGEPDAAVAGWRQRLRDGLGDDAAVMVEVVPSLARLLGHTPPAPVVDLARSQARLVRLFRSFLGVVAGPDAPLVLLLDEAQWIDADSAAVLGALVTGDTVGGVLPVLAFRSADVSDEHLVRVTERAARAAGTLVADIHLPPLAASDVQSLLAEALAQRPDAVAPLAELLHSKTLGNPFFLRQLLGRLTKEGALTPDPLDGGWRWDLAEIRQAEITDNVADLMVWAIRRLPAEAQEALTRAACIGDRFDAALLTGAWSRPEREVTEALRLCVRSGLLFAVHTAGLETEPTAYRFAHPRVHQAAYSLLGDAARQEAHFRTGQAILGGDLGREERLFEALDQINQGHSQIEDAAARVELAELNLRAAHRATEIAAYGPATGYLTQARALLPPSAWDSLYDLAIDVHLLLARCTLLGGSGGAAEDVLAEAATHARTAMHRAQICTLRVDLANHLSDNTAALEWGRRGLEALGHELPGPTDREAAALELRDVARRLEEVEVSALVEAPRMTDPEQRASMGLMSAMTGAAYSSDQVLFRYLTVRMVSVSLEHGISVHSADAYVWLGVLLATVGGELSAGLSIGRVGLALAERMGDAAQKARVLLAFASHLSHWSTSLRGNLGLYREARALAEEAARPQLVALCDAAEAMTLLAIGEDLGQVLGDADDGDDPGAPDASGSSLDADLAMRAAAQAVACLRGKTRGAGRLGADGFDEDAHVEAIGNHMAVRASFDALRLHCAYLLGDIERASALAAETTERAGHLLGTVWAAQGKLFTALTLGALHDQGSEVDGAAIRQTLDRLSGELREWAGYCPENFGHAYALVAAQRARARGDAERALELYDVAIEAARRSGFVRDQALANELAGRVHLSLGHARVAGFYLRAALRGYARWGAHAVADTLRAELGDLALPEHESGGISLGNVPAVSPGLPALDLLSVVRAGQAISSEVHPERLLENMLRIVLETAGAQRGFVVTAVDGRLVVRASGELRGDLSFDLTTTPLDEADRLCGAIVRYVAKTQEALVLPDASADARFSGDSYVQSRTPRSVLCVPMRQQGRFAGAVYLENNLTTHAFTGERVEILKLLSTQIAISLDNGVLFEDLWREIGERRRAETAVQELNDQLERRVAERTGELEVANAELQRSNDELEQFAYVVSHDLQEPLRVVTGFTDLLDSRFGDELGETARRYVRLANEGAGRMRELIQDLLAYARVGTRRTTPTATPVDHVLDDVLVDLAAALGESGATVTRGPLPTVLADRPQLRHVLVNLVGNAVKYRGEAAPRIHVSATEGAAEWTISVEDNGIGIDPKFFRRIFQVFQRLHAVGDYPGTGIGLAIARKAVQSHGGRIWVDSESGKGATFSFSWPKGEAVQPQVAPAAPEEEAADVRATQESPVFRPDAIE